jgi:hypothetical protein
VTERLPELLDCKALRDELGISRAAAEAIIRHLRFVPPDDQDTLTDALVEVVTNHEERRSTRAARPR